MTRRPFRYLPIWVQHVLSNCHFAWIRDLTMCSYPEGAEASGEIVWQPKSNLRECSVGYWSHIFGRYVVSLIITVEQIHDDRGGGLVLEQLEIGNEQNYTRVSVR